MTRRTILAVENVSPNTPSRWRDLVELRLECGHVGRRLRLARLRGDGREAPHADLVGQRIECRRCRTEQRLRRTGRGRRSPALGFPPAPSGPGLTERRVS